MIDWDDLLITCDDPSAKYTPGTPALFCTLPWGHELDWHVNRMAGEQIVSFWPVAGGPKQAEFDAFISKRAGLKFKFESLR